LELICRITAAENLEIDRYKKEKLSPEKYTIKVANVGVVKNIYLLMNELIDHFNQVGLTHYSTKS